MSSRSAISTPPTPSPELPMGIRAYAFRRGVTSPAVTKAVRDGRLKASIVYVDGQPKIGDPDLADREWVDGSSRSPAIAASGTSAPRRDDDQPTLADASRQQKIWQARTAELEYRQAAGELVEREAITMRWADICTRVRTHLMGVPGKLKARYPELTLEQIAHITAGIREALEDLADGCDVSR